MGKEPASGQDVPRETSDGSDEELSGAGRPRYARGDVSRETARRRREAEVPRETSIFEGPGAIDRVAEALTAVGADPTRADLLLEHARAVWKSADRLGLVSDRTLGRILARHTLNSLGFAAARTPVAGQRWADVGSGAGFPGLVLALAFPETDFVLIESQQRRAGFLELQALDLKARNAKVFARRLQQLPEDGRDFDVVTTRAFSSSEASGVSAETFELLVSIAKVPGGKVVIAAGESAEPPQGSVRQVRVVPPAVDSPTRYLMMDT